jgi:peptidoglycan hydrolase-like protein with peptidoglycan-binding domain
MAAIELTPDLLRRLARRNNFAVPDTGMVFVCIRGGTPADLADNDFAPSRTIREIGLDYEHMRCTFVQWRLDDGTLALFVGSTVPNRKSIDAALAGKTKANQVIPGCFRYVRGRHKGSSPSGHDAFRQNIFLPVQRTRDDGDFDLADAIDFARSAKAEEFVWDNIHAAYNDDAAKPGYSSEGCLVVCGFPSTTSGKFVERGPWKAFRRNAYDQTGGQQEFTCMLFEADEVARVASGKDGDLIQLVRYGSRGTLVGQVQAALVKAGFEIGTPDDKFGRNTLIALYEFQKRLFDQLGADCVVGPETAKALGIEMPTLAGGPAPGITVRPQPLLSDVIVVRPTGIDPADIPERFSIEVIRAAQASQRKWGVPASITLAQWALESAYGKRMPMGSNNPFGIKALPGQKSVAAMTKEEIGGKLVSKQQPFRVFDSLDEAFIKHAELLGTSKHYVRARMFGDDPDAFADALTGIYATDSLYGQKLKSIMRKNDLYRFDLGEAGPVVTEEPIIIFRESGVGDFLQIGMSGKRVTDLQQDLVRLGYGVGDVDGKFGTLTRGALLEFQADNDVPATGIVDPATQRAFEMPVERPLAPARTEATEQDLANRGSRIIKDAGMGRIASWITAAFGALGIGNSAVVNAVGTTGPGGQAGNALLPFLVDVQRLSEAGRATTAELARLAGEAKTLREGLGSGLSPEAVQTVQQIRGLLPQEFVARFPELRQFLDAVNGAAVAKPAASNVFELLAGNLPAGGALHSVVQVLGTVGTSMIPGFGGSVAVLGLGLLGRHLANRIAAARLDDHRTGMNIAR